MARHVSSDDRQELEAALERQLGAGPTTTLMALLPPVDWSEVARQPDLIAVRDDVAVLKTDVAALKTEFREFRSEVRGDLVTMRADNKEFQSFVREDLAGMRVEIAALWFKLFFTIVGSMIGFGGVIIAAVKL